MSQESSSSAMITTNRANISNDADSTPLYIAFGCAVGVFMLLMLIIILDTLCRNRRKRVSVEKKEKITKGIKSTIPASTSSADEEFQEELPSTSSEEYEINESEIKRPLSDVLLERLEEVEEDSRFYDSENPLDYGYEGGDNSEIMTAD
ncbi:uncharacterized protein DEA37_0014141 [Paragonimus westermani]|uniref:Uncharacterized protein n=1 Tax=Paragonimus westermani TaxID=34504 RepID=A0A5J4NVG5_9TREM|nr:uncharacterized protein DEA37_0014141 [Paragonimus westermani]